LRLSAIGAAFLLPRARRADMVILISDSAVSTRRLAAGRNARSFDRPMLEAAGRTVAQETRHRRRGLPLTRSGP
jgi:hypothetical protein